MDRFASRESARGPARPSRKLGEKVINGFSRVELLQEFYGRPFAESFRAWRWRDEWRTEVDSGLRWWGLHFLRWINSVELAIRCRDLPTGL